ncbi:MAG: hypothetical protein ACI4D1_10650 [Lachnospira sp.]
MVNLNELDDELFKIVHISQDWEAECREFATNPEGKGLQIYINYYALSDEINNVSRTYLVVDKISNKIAAYFTLRTGLITVSRGLFKGFDTKTGIELANFAVNEAYRQLNDVKPRFGAYVFDTFILPLVKSISNFIGAEFLYIFALPKYKLMEHYKTLGFTMTTRKMERFVYRHVKPAYDKNCRFMYQRI